MKALANRVCNMLFHPLSEWQAIRDESTTYKDILFRYVAILAVIPPAAAIAGRYLLDRKISNSIIQSSFGYVAFTNLLWYCMYVLNVVIAGAVITAVITTPESRWSGGKGFKIAAYSFTPFFIAGLIAVFPKMGWIVYVAILYSICLLYQGIVSLSSARRTRAAGYAVASFLSAAVILGVMNLFEYVLETFVTSRMSL
jgi:Yip1 domain